MTTPMIRTSSLSVLITFLLPFAAPAPGAAQVGAIGAAPGVFAGGESGTAWAPILVESALQPARGQFGGSAFFARTSGTVTLSDGFDVLDFDYDYDQLVVGAFYAPSDRLLLGVFTSPHLGMRLEANGESVDDSGRGDVSLYGKVRLWQSVGGETALATFGSLALPAGEDGWRREGVVAGAGVAVSHRLDKLALHGSGSFAYPTDELDGKTTLGLSAAAVYGVSPRLAVSLETMAASSDGESVVDVSPGARVRLGSFFYLHGGVLFNASSSFDEKPYDYAFVLGGQFVR